MRIVDSVTVGQNVADTKTIEHFGRLLGTKPHKLGTVVTMYPHLSISTLTDALKNVFYNPKQDNKSFTPIDSMCIEWKIDVNFIKVVTITGNITGSGLGKNVETILLKESYYNKHDTFTLENKQQLRVVSVPKKVGPEKWAYRVVLVGNDRDRTINVSFAAKGKKTRYRSNYHPELSERGYTRFVSNSETHRNYISRQRASVSYSGDYSLMEEVYIQAGKDSKDAASYFKLNKKEKECMDDFLTSRENNIIFSETNYDVNGKCLDQEEDGRDIPMGDGVIPQIERYCDKYSYSVITRDVVNTVLSTMRSKSENPTGNTYAVVCNERMYDQLQVVMESDLRFISQADGAWFYSKDKQGKVSLGAEFVTYKFSGNSVSFMVDRSLSQEYPDHGYGIFLDTGADLTTGRPNLAMFSLKGSEIFEGTLNGMGGRTGNASGEISTSTHGGSYHLMGYAGVCLFNPYRSFLLEESVTL